MRHICLLLISFVVSSAAAAQVPPALKALQADARPRIDSVATFVAEGRQDSEGLSSAWREAVDRRSGYWSVSVTHRARSFADGADAQGRWHRDISAAVHPFDSNEARLVAVTEGWLLRMGWLDDDGTAYAGAASDNGMLRVEATPLHGRAVTLWIDPSAKRVVRELAIVLPHDNPRVPGLSG